MDVEDAYVTALHVNARLDTEIENLSARIATIATGSSPGQLLIIAIFVEKKHRTKYFVMNVPLVSETFCIQFLLI